MITVLVAMPAPVHPHGGWVWFLFRLSLRRGRLVNEGKRAQRGSAPSCVSAALSRNIQPLLATCTGTILHFTNKSADLSPAGAWRNVVRDPGLEPSHA